MTAFDGRRRRYVPVDVNLAFGTFGTRLLDKWGMEGLCAWMLLLAAAKREPVQGTFTFTTEPELWTKLGATPTAFTGEEFLRFCGHHKQTSRRRSGRVQHVKITGWEQWNDTFDRQTASQQKARKRAQNTPDITRTMRGRHGDDARTELEGELEDEVEYESEKPERVDETGLTVKGLTGGFDARELLGGERHSEYARLIESVCDGDAGTPRVIAGLCKPLPVQAIRAVADAYRGKPVQAGKVVNALKQRRREFDRQLRAEASAA